MNSPAVTEKKQTLIINKDTTHYDRKYYDVELLTEEETTFCLDIGTNFREGEIIVLSPNKEKKSGTKIHRFNHAGELFSSEKKQIKAVVVAGVGSSMLGTAALARSVANVYDLDVAGIVSGHGTKDLTDEALEGWFFNRTWDMSQQYLRLINDNMNTLSKFTPFPWYFNPFEVPLELLEATTKDVRTAIEILEAPASEVQLILGHSKGSLVIDRALEFIAQKYQSHALFDKLNVVSVSTVLNFPQKFKHIFQFLGEFDSLGEKNSRHLVEFEMVTGAEHALRPDSPLSLDRLLPNHPQLKSIFSAPKAPEAKVKQPVKAEPVAKAEQPVKTEPVAKAEQPLKTEPAAKAEQPVKAEPAAKAEQPLKTEPVAKAEQPLKTEPAAKAEQPVKAEPAAKAEQPVKAEPAAKAEQPVKAEPAAKAEQPVKAEPAAKAEQPVKAAPAAKKAPVRRKPAAKKTQPPKRTPATKGTKS